MFVNRQKYRVKGREIQLGNDLVYCSHKIPTKPDSQGKDLEHSDGDTNIQHFELSAYESRFSKPLTCSPEWCSRLESCSRTGMPWRMRQETVKKGAKGRDCEEGSRGAKLLRLRTPGSSGRVRFCWFGGLGEEAGEEGAIAYSSART